MDPYITHDLKTDRVGISSGLPAILKFIPIAFYCSLFGAGASALWFQKKTTDYEAESGKWKMVLVTESATKAASDGEMAKINQEIVLAQEVGKWAEGARPVQSLMLGIARSIKPGASIADIKMDRNPEIPSQLMMIMRLNGGGAEQLEDSHSAIEAANYRTYSAQQTKKEGSVDYQATLIWKSDQTAEEAPSATTAEK